jgi:hypothetical protein
MGRFISYYFLPGMLLILTSCSFLGLGVASPTQTDVYIEIDPTTSTTPSPQPTLTAKTEPAELLSIDSEWNRYTNTRLGFTMLIPKTMYHGTASCYWNEEGGDFSYRPQAGKVPVVVIEGDDRVYITSKYRVSLTEPTAVPSGQGSRHNFSGCDWLENDLDSVSNRDYSSYIWEIAVRPINTDQDLETLVDDYYGECFSVGEFKPVENKDYYLVSVLGDQKPIEESTCLLRGMYIFIYSQEYKIAATWKTGQMVHFSAYGPNEGPYDNAMYDSFQFLPNDHNQ